MRPHSVKYWLRMKGGLFFFSSEGDEDDVIYHTAGCTANRMDKTTLHPKFFPFFQKELLAIPDGFQK